MRYEKYNHSGIVWLGEIPVGWMTRRLKDIGKGIIGLTYSPADIVDERDGGILVLRSSNIQNDKIDFANNVFVKIKPNRNLIVRKGDILICSRNGSRALIGKNICIDENSAGHSFGAFMTVFRTKQFGYVSYYFKSQLFDFQSGAFMTSTINQLTINTLNNLIIPIPSHSDQIAIAQYLDTKTQAIDKKINLLNKKAETYKELRKSIINDAVCKGLDKNVKLMESGIDWIGKIPEHWEVKRLKALGEIETSSVNKKIEEDEELVKLVNYTDVYGNMNKEIWNNDNYMVVSANKLQFRYKRLRQGDVLFTPSSETIEDIGVSAVVMEDLKNTLYSYHILRLKFNVKMQLNFKKYLFNNDFVQEYFSKSATGTTRKILGLNTFYNLPIVYPPTIKEQTAIAKYLDEKTQKIDAIISNIRKQIDTLNELRKTLINDVVTGKIKITPN